ncbi:hypothetical protein C1646_738973 [Rhizophagus diaphanus]|nr:hypothetical protein C1646_738973 [Rhizophagus diaphanus] [Rhizophagus sp. MUCL 43196]
MSETIDIAEPTNQLGKNKDANMHHEVMCLNCSVNKTWLRKIGDSNTFKLNQNIFVNHFCNLISGKCPWEIVVGKVNQVWNYEYFGKIWFEIFVSAVVGVPVENLRNQTFSTDSIKFIPTKPRCTDPIYTKYISSVCATRKSARVTCESYDLPGTIVDTHFSCGEGESCIDITSNDAFCVDENSKLVQEWENNHVDGRVCSAPVLIVPPPNLFSLAAGITTYSTTGDPIQVTSLEARYDDKNSDDYTE